MQIKILKTNLASNKVKLASTQSYTNQVVSDECKIGLPDQDVGLSFEEKNTKLLQERLHLISNIFLIFSNNQENYKRSPFAVHFLK